MFYHIITSTECNLECKYCVREEWGKPLKNYDYCLPARISYDIEKLKNFVTKEDYITFYGGEPLLDIEIIKKIMDNIECKGFMTQTNGLLMDRLGSYVSKFHTILISIDGNEQITDVNRGKGVHKKVMENIKIIKRNGFKGELITRMTITKNSNVYNQVLWLYQNGFENIHWQLDAMFFTEKDDWLDNYNKQIKILVDYWINKMENGKVLRWYPFLAVMKSILTGEKNKLRCGSGHSNFTIATNGKVVPCPIMCGMKSYYSGDLDSKELKEYYVGEPCSNCSDLDLCGGRCLYSNITKLWDEQNYKRLCKSVKNLINCLRNKQKEIKKLISEKKIKIEDFDYLKYNGVEIIP